MASVDLCTAAGGHRDKTDELAKDEMITLDGLILARRRAHVGRSEPESDKTTAEEEIKAIQRAATPNLGFYVGVIVLAIFLPKVAAFGYLVIALIGVMRVRGDQSTTPGKPVHGG